MEQLFVDTNIVLDLLAQRAEFFQEAQELFTRADLNKVELTISALTFANTHYILSKHLKLEETRKILNTFKVLVNVAPVDDKIIELALASDFKDFEDAIQYYSALESKAQIIITRNKKDFKYAKIPIMTAKEYIRK
ncbi:MAG: PIN domain-containing protein [Crocinitomicaceae bacterium]|nr:PIN domain-containing protein [Crocinitomicaceae bacterium]